MDCDDVILLLAKEPDTLTGYEASQLHKHVITCESCQRLTVETSDDERWRWIARLPEDAFEDPDMLVLPVIDPVVFVSGEEIAKGGMGRITRARDRRLGREVAIKEILEDDLRARFEREATITARLQHPAIVPIYEAGTWPNGSAFYTMRLVSGGTLAQAIDRTTTLEQRLALLPHVIAVTEALAYAHSQKIIHRDLKPQNVLVGEFGETVVIDWGLAKELDRDIEAYAPPTPRLDSKQDLTLVGSIMGTPCFMPPEQASGGELDERADVYALGALLYNVLAGQPPYWDRERDTPQKLLDATMREPPTPVVVHAPRAPEDLRAIVERAMARDKKARYPTAREMAEELRRFQAGKLITSRDYGTLDLIGRWVGRHRAVVAVASLAVVALAVVGVLAFVNVARSRDAERDARVVAEEARGKVDISVAGLLEEQGRSELLAGHRDRAIAYLAEAYRMGRSDVAIRHLLAEATRDLTLLERTLDAGRDGSYSGVGFRADGKLVTFRTERLDVWDGDAIVDSFGLGFEARHWRFALNGERAAVYSDTDLAMIDLATGKKLWTQKGDYSDATLVFDPEATRLAILSKQPVVVLDAVTGKLIGKLADKEKETTAAAFILTGEIVATASSEGLISIWQLSPLEMIGGIRLARTITDIEWAGAAVVMATKEHEAHIWNPAETQYHVLGGHRDEITALAVSSGGALIATGDRSGGVKLWDANGDLLGEAAQSSGAIRILKFAPDGNMIVAGGEDPRTYVWNTSLGLRGVLQASPDQYDSIADLAWGPKDRLATIDDSGKHVHVWKKPKAGLILHLHGTTAGTAGSIVAHFGERGLEVHDLAKGKLLHTIAGAKAPVDGHHMVDRPHMAISADARRALTWGKDGAIVYDLVTEKELRRFAATDPETLASATTWQLSRDGSHAVELTEKHLRVFDVDSGMVALERSDDYATVAGALSPTGDALVFPTDPVTTLRLPGGEASKLLQLDYLKTSVVTASGRRIETASAIDEAMTFDPTGVRLIVTGVDAALVVEAATARTLMQLRMPMMVSAGALDDGGHHAVTQGQDATSLWNADTGELQFTVPGTAPGAFAIAHDGSRLATGHPDGTVRIWDQQGRLLEVIHDHRRAIEHLAFSDDGTRLLAEANDNWISVVDVHLEQRPAAEIAKIAAAATSWTVSGGALVLRKSK